VGSNPTLSASRKGKARKGEGGARVQEQQNFFSCPLASELPGEMREWLNRLDWKSSVAARSPGVRIPLSPPLYIDDLRLRIEGRLFNPQSSIFDA
tara:strand:- start:692 stop:976 length:285 start_codon:yes stop_codon:yes gene_type:complete